MRTVKIIAGVCTLTSIFVLGGCGAIQKSKPSVVSTIPSSTHTDNSNPTSGESNGSANNTGILTVGKMAPDEPLVSAKSMQEVHLSSFLGKKPLIINAWASWCPPCQEETPDLVIMYEKYRSKVEFLGVNMTTLDNIQNAKSFAVKYAIPYPVLLDTHGSFYRDYSVIAEPMTYVVSPAGKVLSIHIGALTTSQIQQLVQQAMASK